MKDIKPRCSFRSAEEWKSALMILPDKNFFELLRSIFGNIKTPYNKQRLLDDLFILLSRNEIRETIAIYIDAQDHKVIAAVALLDEPASGELESFFSGEYSCAELHALIINLEERLILYRFRSDGVPRLALNPVLEPVLAPFIADTGALFPRLPRFPRIEGEAGSRGDPPPADMSDGRVLSAFFAFLAGEDEPLKAEGFLRKKILDDGKKLFRGLDLDLIVKTLLWLGMLRTEGRSLIPCGEKIADYCALSRAEREEYWAAGLYLCLVGDEGEASAAQGDREPGVSFGSGAGYLLSRGRLRRIASFLHGFLLHMDPERQYPAITLKRLIYLLDRELAGTGNFIFDRREQFSLESVLAVLEKAGILERGTDDARAECFSKAPVRDSGNEDEPSGPVIVMDTAFSFVLYPEISFADAMTLGTFCAVKDTAVYRRPDSSAVVFELTRSSVIRGFDQGISSESMMKLLNRLSHNRLDANLDWTLRDWENRYTGVSLHQGIVLTLAEDRRYLAETRPLASLIRRILAPGVYLLSTAERFEAVKALRKAGVDIIAQPPPVSGVVVYGSGVGSRDISWPGADRAARNSFSSLESLSVLPFLRYHEKGEKPALYREAEAVSIRENFRRVLDSMRLTRAQREEITARISRRLVLSETQLTETSLRYEKLEARGLDYQGKLAIAREALANGSLVELSWSGPGGEPKQIVGVPSALEKDGGESVLVLRDSAASPEASGVPGNTVRIPGNTIRIPLGKISLLRRIKQSIFGE